MRVQVLEVLLLFFRIAENLKIGSNRPLIKYTKILEIIIFYKIVM